MRRSRPRPPFGGPLCFLLVLVCAGEGLAGDIQVGFSTYLGGLGEDTIRDVAFDAAGNIYVTGGTASSAFPTTAGAYDQSQNGSMDVFAAKFNPQGQLIWSTLLGGSNYDRAYAIEVDNQGYVYVAGRAGAGFPTTSGVLQGSFAGDSNPNPLYGQQDGFLAKINPDGSGLAWSTYFGDSARGFIRDLDVDSSGNVYVAFTESGVTVPYVTGGAYQTTRGGGQDGVVAKIASDASHVVWGTYVGGSGDDLITPSVRVGADGYVYVAGTTNSSNLPTTPGAYHTSLGGTLDLHVLKLTPNGNSAVYSTYVGGSGVDAGETHNLAIDAQGHVYIGATTMSTNLTATPGAVQSVYGGTGGPGAGQNTNYPGDGFIARLSVDGTALEALTYLGGSAGEGIEGIAIDAQGHVYVSGASYSSNFPLSLDAYQGVKHSDAEYFATVLSANLDQVIYSTYLGGGLADTARALAVGPNGEWAVGGITNSDNWPLLHAYQTSRLGGAEGGLVMFVPEPAAGVLGLVGALAMLVARRRWLAHRRSAKTR